MAHALVIGVDAGGTRTRALLANSQGRVLADGRGGPANPHSGAPDPAHALETALRDALAHHDPSRVIGGCIGIAGAGTTRARWAHEAAQRAWKRVGLPGAPILTDDVTIGFAAGSTSEDGIVLICGTGAVAAAIEHRQVVRRADGYGWLLGDSGSAVWLALHGLRAALAGHDGRGPDTALTDAVAQRLAPDSPPELLPTALLEAVGERTPAQLGELAPLVCEIALRGDPTAIALVERSADHLLAALNAVAGDSVAAVVLAGGLLTHPGPVADRVRAAVHTSYGLTPTTVVSGAAGAAALALTRSPSGLDPAAHARLLEASAQPGFQQSRGTSG